jgi:hypothetical protein
LGPEAYINTLLTLQETAACLLQRPTVTEKFWRDRPFSTKVKTAVPAEAQARLSVLFMPYFDILVIKNNN